MNKTFNDSFDDKISIAKSAHTQRNQSNLRALKTTQDVEKSLNRPNLTSRGPAYKLNALRAGSEAPKKKTILQTETTPRASIPSIQVKPTTN